MSSVKNLNKNVKVRLAVGLALLLAFAAQLIGPVAGEKVARAESFAEPAFEQQWRSTDEAVAQGRVSRTFFWGPQAFAHTNEVYAESPDGQRLVQYFDKARMELSKKAQQDPNYVTNGLLTVELVTGRIQAGDNTFLQRNPAEVPVAGDPYGNEFSPTYATFNRGKLAFEVPGATAAPNRTGQPVVEGVNRAGEVSKLSQTPAAVTYSRYFQETGHNLADVFDRFFQSEPPGESRWLAVMGYPVSEPFWAKDNVIVGGVQKAVLVQLFQRRALTFTPSNSPEWQVEMGNIGQHYYAWRYNLLPAYGPVPGNFRLLVPQGNSLISSSISKPENFKVGEAADKISGLWPSTQGTALVWAGAKAYLADLVRGGPLRAMPVDSAVKDLQVQDASWSADGRRLAVLFASQAPDQYGVPEYNKSTVQIYDLNQQNVSGSFVAYDNLKIYNPAQGTLKLSPDGKYLAFFAPTEDLSGWINLLDVASRQQQPLKIGDYLRGTGLEWVAGSGQLLASFEPLQPDKSGKALLLDPASLKVNTLLENQYLLRATVSPDGNYLAVMSRSATGSWPDVPNVITFRKLANPGVEIAPAYQQLTGGRGEYQAGFAGWGRDGTYVVVKTSAHGTGGHYREDFNLVSLVTGTPLNWNKTDTYFINTIRYSLAGTHYLLRASDEPNPVTQETRQALVVRNLDGKSEITLLSSYPQYRYRVELAQVVSVPVKG